MKNEEFNPSQSFSLIEDMINTAKNQLADDGFLFILWGWVVFSAAMIQYTTVMLHVPYGELTWATLLPAAGIVSMFYGRRKKQREKAQSYVNLYLGYVWVAFIIA